MTNFGLKLENIIFQATIIISLIYLITFYIAFVIYIMYNFLIWNIKYISKIDKIKYISKIATCWERILQW